MPRSAPLLGLLLLVTAGTAVAAGPAPPGEGAARLARSSNAFGLDRDHATGLVLFMGRVADPSTG